MCPSPQWRRRWRSPGLQSSFPIRHLELSSTIPGMSLTMSSRNWSVIHSRVDPRLKLGTMNWNIGISTYHGQYVHLYLVPTVPFAGQLYSVALDKVAIEGNFFLYLSQFRQTSSKSRLLIVIFSSTQAFFFSGHQPGHHHGQPLQLFPCSWLRHKQCDRWRCGW